ncbi:hypothetical protein, partial [Pseudomonas aeruginosa]|uniref:hypothetical protein n=1 Tax=Pseudomonas aeruginosa TaxID=287 RepID=UPI0022EBF64E
KKAAEDQDLGGLGQVDGDGHVALPRILSVCALSWAMMSAISRMDSPGVTVQSISAMANRPRVYAS